MPIDNPKVRDMCAYHPCRIDQCGQVSISHLQYLVHGLMQHGKCFFDVGGRPCDKTLEKTDWPDHFQRSHEFLLAKNKTRVKRCNFCHFFYAYDQVQSNHVTATEHQVDNPNAVSVGKAYHRALIKKQLKKLRKSKLWCRCDCGYVGHSSKLHKL
jgi:hypothetical protein